MSITLQKLLKTTLYIFHTVTVHREIPLYPEKKSFRRKDFIWYSLQKPTSCIWSALPGSFFFSASTIHAYLQFWCLPLSKGKILVSKPLLNTSRTVSLVSSLTLLVRLYSHHWKAQNIKHTYTYIQKSTWASTSVVLSTALSTVPNAQIVSELSEVEATAGRGTLRDWLPNRKWKSSPWQHSQ